MWDILYLLSTSSWPTFLLWSWLQEPVATNVVGRDLTSEAMATFGFLPWGFFAITMSNTCRGPLGHSDACTDLEV